MNASVLSAYNHEEGDTRMFLLVLHFALRIITDDTDVFYHSTWVLFSIKTRWVEFGAGKYRRRFPIHTHAHLLGGRIFMELTILICFYGL